MADSRGRLRKIRQGLSPAEWTRLGGMVAAVVYPTSGATVPVAATLDALATGDLTADPYVDMGLVAPVDAAFDRDDGIVGSDPQHDARAAR